MAIRIEEMIDVWGIDEGVFWYGSWCVDGSEDSYYKLLYIILLSDIQHSRSYLQIIHSSFVPNLKTSEVSVIVWTAIEMKESVVVNGLEIRKVDEGR